MPARGYGAGAGYRSVPTPDPTPENMVRPSGPAPCRVLLVGEAPGYEEHLARRPFVGRSGQVLDTYLLAARISRSDVRVTNLYPWWPGEGNPDPTPEQAKLGGRYLVSEIGRSKPKFVLAVGAHATRWFRDKAGLREAPLDTIHGIPFHCARLGVTVVPCYHPAAGMRVPELAAKCADDIRQFAALVRGDLAVPVTPTRDLALRWYNPKWDLVDGTLVISGAVDTEGLRDRPWGMSWCPKPGVGIVISYDSLAELASRGRVRYSGTIIFHHSLHDMDILAAMGAPIPLGHPVEDTMSMSYVLGLEPRGLKPLAYRHLGLEMQDFTAVVRPYHDEVGTDYLLRAGCETWPDPEPQLVPGTGKRKGRWVVYQPQNLNRRITNILDSYIKDKTTNLHKSWLDIPAEVRQPAESALGPFPEFSLHCVPGRVAMRYAALDPVATYSLANPLLARIKAQDLTPVYEMDRATIPMFAYMQQHGLLVDQEYTRRTLAEMDDKARRLASTLTTVAAVSIPGFLPSSGDDVARLLYKHWGCPVTRKTKTRASADDKALSFAIRHLEERGQNSRADWVRGLQEYRELLKYRGTYLEAILRYVRPSDSRLHPNLKIATVVSGRISSEDPNILAFPVRTELGKLIRNCIVAPAGFTLLSVDYSQLELRLMASLSRDPVMLQAFTSGVDLHTLTASRLFGVSMKKMTGLLESGDHGAKAQRYAAKTINFAVLYGISAHALYEQLLLAGITTFSEPQCADIIRDWFKLYAGVREFINDKISEGQQRGFVTDPWGRPRWLPNLRLDAHDYSTASLRAEAERFAGNHPIQGGAAGLIKRAQARIWSWLLDKHMLGAVYPVLQIHDELLLEVAEGCVNLMSAEIQRLMLRDQDRFAAPLKVSAAHAPRWGSIDK